MNPMPSGGDGEAGAEGAGAAGVGTGLAQESADPGGAGAVGEAGAAGAGEALGRARAGAETAMQAAAAGLHDGLAALAAAAGAGAAARGGQEIAGAVAVLQMPAAIGREGGGGARLRNQTINPMPSGDGRGSDSDAAGQWPVGDPDVFQNSRPCERFLICSKQDIASRFFTSRETA